MANTWQHKFPHRNLCTDGLDRISPVTAFPPNGYGLHDMIGNVWEWTSDRCAPNYYRRYRPAARSAPSLMVLDGGRWAVCLFS